MDLTRVVEWFEEHRKFVAALVVAIGVAIAVVTDDKHLDLNDILTIVGAFVGAGAVERVPNKRRD